MRERKFVQTVLVMWPRWPSHPYMVKRFTFFFSGTNRPTAWKHSIQHSGLGLYNIYSNDDPGLALTYFIARSNLLLIKFLYGKCLNTRFYRNYWSLRPESVYKQYTKWVHEYICVPTVKVVVWPLCKVTQIYIFQPLLLQSCWVHWSQFQVEHLWVGRMEVCSNGPGHLTQMASMPIYGKNPLKIFFSEPHRPITFELGIQHQGLGPYTICSNNDHRLTMAYFTTRSTLLPNAFISMGNAQNWIL